MIATGVSPAASTASVHQPWSALRRLSRWTTRSGPSGRPRRGPGRSPRPGGRGTRHQGRREQLCRQHPLGQVVDAPPAVRRTQTSSPVSQRHSTATLTSDQSHQGPPPWPRPAGSRSAAPRRPAWPAPSRRPARTDLVPPHAPVRNARRRKAKYRAIPRSAAGRPRAAQYSNVRGPARPVRLLDGLPAPARAARRRPARRERASTPIASSRTAPHPAEHGGDPPLAATGDGVAPRNPCARSVIRRTCWGRVLPQPRAHP